ncbi:peptide-methionine (S)-S-oxide reductase [Nitrosovibrio tenuis]|nr:peptide-methionine (S)-S-oxide reductase [Nitrosovibrio tenuis]
MGAGCFWGVETSFRAVKGVHESICGYSGGHFENHPPY